MRDMVGLRIFLAIVEDFGDPKIREQQQIGIAGRDEHVLRLDITMYYAMLMRMMQCTGHLDHVMDGAAHFQRVSILEVLPKGTTSYILHRQIGLASIFTKVI